MKSESTIAHWRAFMQKVAAEIAAGEGDIKPARIIEKKPNPAKIHIGWFHRRVLRGEFRKRR